MDTPKLYRLPAVDSTNKYAREHFAALPDLCAVYTTDQTAGRGRLGRDWLNAGGKGLYYTAVFKTPLCQPATLPLLASLAVRDVLLQFPGAETRVKWPNDLLLNGKKLVGILCEGILRGPGETGIVCGIGLNLAQEQDYFAAANLPHGTSLVLEGFALEPQKAADALAAALTVWFAQNLPVFAEKGFAPFLPAYRAACVNLGLPVTFEGGRGVARDVDENGNLVVETAEGAHRVFTGEVSVKGVYGAV